MTPVLVLVDGATSSAPVPEGAKTITLTTTGKRPSVRCQIDVFRTKLLREMPRRIEDLLYLAASVYGADTGVSRGSAKDILGANWARQFRIVLPVWDLDFWLRNDVNEGLTDTLRFLTGDSYDFEFVQRTQQATTQMQMTFQEAVDPLPQVNAIVSFSGGADSLAATLEALQQGLQPVVVSHRSAPTIDKRQKNLADLIRKAYPSWALPHVSMWVNRAGGRPVEFSQRSRSFLYTSLCAACAALLEVDTVRLCDNGVVSINLPQSAQNVGTALSRSTHPGYLSRVEPLMRLITDRSTLLIENSLLFRTKREVLQSIADTGHPALLQETVSCAHTEGKTRQQPHCGTCTQCIDRRFASEATGLTAYDLAERYEVDIFTAPLPEGESRTHAENYVRFALELEKLDDATKLFGAYPDLYDCLPDSNADQFAQQVWELFRRHQQGVNGVLEQRLGKHLADIRRGTLPTTCLLRIVGGGEHTVDPKERCLIRLRDLLCRGLPPIFQTKPPDNERAVQDAGEGLFQASAETLHRESPQIPFAAVTTKPDFSVPRGELPPLFLEFKYIKQRRALNRVQTEMTSRVTVYRQQGAWILFLVYDPDRAIADDDKFIGDFQAHEGVWVGIAR